MIKNNFNIVSAKYKRRINKMHKLKRLNPITAAKYMELQLRSLVPVRSGVLASSIKRVKNRVSVGAKNSLTGFPYVHWVNATPNLGLQRVRLVPPFGDGNVHTYAEVAKSGQAGFHTIALRNTLKFDRDLQKKEFERIFKI